MTRLRHLIELIKFPPYQLGKAELVMAKIDSHHQTSKMGNVKKDFQWMMHTALILCKYAALFARIFIKKMGK